MVYGGEGLGRSAGRVVLAPLVLPGERVSLTPLREQPGLVRARLAEVLEPSPRRVTPSCPYFARCGGCHYQHAAYLDQLRYKAEILKETLARIGGLEAPEPEVLAAEPWQYRNRAQFKALKRGPEFHLGYFERGSQRLLDVEECPISSPDINTLLPALRELGRRPDFPQGSGEIELFAAPDQGGLLARLTAAAAVPETLVSAFRESLPGPASLAVEQAGAVATKGVSLDVAARRRRIFGPGHLVYRAAGFAFRVSHGVFFQTNRFLADALAELATRGLEGELALDLFSGTGYFALPLARRFSRVVAVESNPVAVRDLESNRSSAGLSNIEVVRNSAEDFLVRYKGPRPDAVLLDPPRGGLGKAAAEALAGLGAATIVYVSCDPATLARDLARLTGYFLQRLHLADLFPQTFHIESVAVLKNLGKSA